MPSASVVEDFNVFKQASLRFILGAVVYMIHLCGLQCTKETLCHHLVS
jgi:hypothetical protein